MHSDQDEACCWPERLVGVFAASWPAAAQTAGAPAQQPPATGPVAGRLAAHRTAEHGRCDEARAGPAAAIPNGCRQAAGGEAQAAPGLQARALPSGVDNARTLRQGDKGTICQQPPQGQDPRQSSRRTASATSRSSSRPVPANGIVLHNGTLYIAELSQVSKIDKIEDNLASPPKRP